MLCHRVKSPASGSVWLMYTPAESELDKFNSFIRICLALDPALRSLTPSHA